MADHTHIEWTDATWNPLAGCSLVSPGCTNCYAMRDAHRLANNPSPKVSAKYEGTTRLVKGKPVWTGRVNLADDATLTQPLRWSRPRRIFVNSMSDLFHEDVPDEWIDRIFAVMALCPQHQFQVLTKRAARMREYMTDPATMANIYELMANMAFGKAAKAELSALGSWPLPNVWLGVSAEDQTRADERIPLLLETPAAIRWISAEPLLGGLDLLPWLDRLDWVVVGGESGPGARPMHPDWVHYIRRQCTATATPFLFKQWGAWVPSTPEKASGNPRSGWRCLAAHPHVPRAKELYPDTGAAFVEHVGKKAAGRLLDGVEHNGYPEIRS